jgi:galactokinase
MDVDLGDLDPREKERGSPDALIRGIAAGFSRHGCRFGGFDARVVSGVPIGGGLSSSAAFEVLLGGIQNHLFNEGRVDYMGLAHMAHAAENDYFGKPCGLMDQIASAAGGLTSIDFMDPGRPKVRRVDVDFQRHGYCLAVVNTGGSHADLTPDYAAIPTEMRAAASVLGHDTARGLTMEELLAALPSVRRQAGDRAVLRLVHFIEENNRAALQADALAEGHMDEFLRLVNASGDSSWRLLQNCFSVRSPVDQPIPLALMLTQRFLDGEGACRVHGGGFAGTIQAYIPLDRFDRYRERMESVFGPGSVIPLRVRNAGISVIEPTNY